MTPRQLRRPGPLGTAKAKPDRWQRGTVVAGFVSVLLVADGLYQTNEANNASQDAATHQLQLATQQQTAQRFTDAIGQLGQEDTNTDNNKLSVRLGAIYALDRLMRDAPPYEPAVIGVLCAFLRTHARPYTRQRTRPTPQPRGQNPTVDNATYDRDRTSAPDLVAAFVAIARRPDAEEARNRDLDLQNTFLALEDVQLQDAHLAGTDLRGYDLAYARLDRADLTGATLRETSLVGACLLAANLTGADLYGADFESADLRGANLTGAQHGSVVPYSKNTLKECSS